MSYNTAVEDLRVLLSDTESHKRATNKRLVGNIDGNNTIFYTYDKRIVEDSLSVRVDNEDVSFSLDSHISGKIILGSAPDINSDLRADYYWQFWLDDELTGFLNRGAQACSQYDDGSPEKSYTDLPPGLRTAGLYFAASDCNKSLIQYLNNRRHSEEFLLEQDGNDDKNHSDTIAELRKGAKDYWDQAIQIRDDYWERQGRRNKPSFAIKPGVTRRYGPNR